MANKVEKALSKAVEVLYFDDNSDFGTALWQIVTILGGEDAYEMLTDNAQKAYETYVSGLTPLAPDALDDLENYHTKPLSVKTLMARFVYKPRR